MILRWRTLSSGYKILFGNNFRILDGHQVV